MRKLLLTAPLLAVLALGCQNKAPVGPGTVTITETTTSTSTTTSTTTTTAVLTAAKFVFSPVTPEVLQVVNFDASTSTPGSSRTIVDYTWDFGDGESKKGVKTTHDYAKAGIYLVRLTVTDDQGKATPAEPQMINVRPIS